MLAQADFLLYNGVNITTGGIHGAVTQRIYPEPAGRRFPLSTDSMVLSHFVRLPKNARVLDLGSGCGTLGLLLCAVNESCRVTGVELSQSAHLAAIDNIRRNGLTTRMESICVDVRQVPGSFPPGSFDVCVSNPPYFSGGPASRTAALARREDACSPADLFRAAAWALKYGGDFSSSTVRSGWPS